MPFIETVTELAESLATALGIYGQHRRFDGMTIEETKAYIDEHQDYLKDHADDCGCRPCWVGRMTDRIRAAVANERHLSKG